jgi:hypothetical protein
MNRLRIAVAPCLAVVGLAAGCATPQEAPIASNPATPPSCARLAADLATTDEARLAAIEDGRGAWKAVVPFAVAAKYAKSQADVRRAEDRLQSLNAEYSQQGCARVAG